MGVEKGQVMVNYTGKSVFADDVTIVGKFGRTIAGHN